MAILSDLAPKLGCLRAAVLLHNYILNGVLHAPELFFDITPVGRILSRLSKDVDVLDSGLPQQITSSLACLFKVSILQFFFLFIFLCEPFFFCENTLLTKVFKIF